MPPKIYDKMYLYYLYPRINSFVQRLTISDILEMR